MIPGGFAAGAVTSEGGSDASRTQRYATSNPDALSVRREHRSLPVDFTSAQTRENGEHGWASAGMFRAS